MPKANEQSSALTGWQQIAEFLGQPVSVAQRWAKSGMPVARVGRRIHASRDELNRWLGRESAGGPVKIATESADLSSELKRGLTYLRKNSPSRHPTAVKQKEFRSDHQKAKR